MSGHSKWHKIQHKKGKADKARSSMFTKLLRAVTVAAQQGGGDPDMNFSLRIAVQKAKAGNVPKDNIERAIKKGTGELDGGSVFEEVIYEGFGPNGVAVLVEALTDNRNRAASDIKHAFSKSGGSLGGPGSVQWQFDHKAVIRLNAEQQANCGDWDEAQLSLMDVGVEEIQTSEFGVELVAPMEQFQSVLDAVKSLGVEEPEDAGLEWIAKEPLSVDDEVSEKIDAMIDRLDESDDVREVYTNLA
jgi:YebC/PmpR family DNA-binding regulatory protein